MDILKIRKKRARERGTDAPPEPGASATADGVVAGHETQADDEAGEPTLPDEAPVAPPTAAAPVEVARRAPGRRVASPVEPADNHADDPLREFLARYDEAADGDDLLGPVEAANAGDARRFLVFELAGEAYAASIMDVKEILRAVALTAVPRAPIQILGVLSKRGVVMPVVDLAATLGLRAPDAAFSAKQRVLVVGEGERVCGLRVDSVQEVVRLQEEDIEEVPASLGSRLAHQLRGLGRIGDRMYILLDVQAVQQGLAVSAGIETEEEV